MSDEKKVWCEECQTYHADLTQDDVTQLGKFLLEQVVEECSKRGCSSDAALKAISDVFTAALRAEMEGNETVAREVLGDFLLKLAQLGLPGLYVRPLQQSEGVN